MIDADTQPDIPFAWQLVQNIKKEGENMHDLLQARIEGFVLAHWYSQDTDQKIATVMLKENIFYDEAKRRVTQAINTLGG